MSNTITSRKKDSGICVADTKTTTLIGINPTISIRIDPVPSAIIENNCKTDDFKGNASSSKITRLMNRLISSLFNINCKGILLANIFILMLLVVTAPAHIKAHRKNIIDQRLEELSLSVNAQKTTLAIRYEKLTTSIKSDSEKLAGELYQMIGLESSGNLEKEVSEKQANIDSIKAELEHKKQYLNEVKSQMEKSELSFFCPECDYSIGKGVISCEERKKFLMKIHAFTENEAMDAVIRVDVNCIN